MRFDFVKSHGLGNDYLVVDADRLGFELTAERVRQICHRHTGVGSDGILAVVTPAQGDFAVRILNPDGSEAEKSGNGLRIFAKFLYDHGYTTRTSFTIETRGGMVRADLSLIDGRVAAVRVEMGAAIVDEALTSLAVDGETHAIVSLSIGNPHCVIIMDTLSREEILRLGPRIETHPVFPNRTNVQLAKVLSRSDVRALIWERGAGHTLASGSSACAVAVACFRKGLVDGRVAVHMEGGDLDVEVDERLGVVMTGPVEETFVGRTSTDLARRLSGPCLAGPG